MIYLAPVWGLSFVLLLMGALGLTGVCGRRMVWSFVFGAVAGCAVVEALTIFGVLS